MQRRASRSLREPPATRERLVSSVPSPFTSHTRDAWATYAGRAATAGSTVRPDERNGSGEGEVRRGLAGSLLHLSSQPWPGTRLPRSPRPTGCERAARRRREEARCYPPCCPTFDWPAARCGVNPPSRPWWWGRWRWASAPTPPCSRSSTRPCSSHCPTTSPTVSCSLAGRSAARRGCCTRRRTTTTIASRRPGSSHWPPRGEEQVRRPSPEAAVPSTCPPWRCPTTCFRHWASSRSRAGGSPRRKAASAARTWSWSARGSRVAASAAPGWRSARR